MARLKLPRLKWPTLPSRLRVPSGNTATFVPKWMRAAARSRLRFARNGLPRSMATWPPRNRNQPMKGTTDSDFLWMMRKDTGKYPKSSGMSKALAWFAAYTAGVGRPERSSTWTRTPQAVRTIRPHRRRMAWARRPLRSRRPANSAGPPSTRVAARITRIATSARNEGRGSVGLGRRHAGRRSRRRLAGWLRGRGRRERRGVAVESLEAVGALAAAVEGTEATAILARPGLGPAAEDHRARGRLQHARDVDLDGLAQGLLALVDYNHRAVVEVADDLARLLAFLENEHAHHLSRQHHGLQGLGELVDVQDRHATKLGDLVEVEVVRHDLAAHLAGQLDQLEVDLLDVGEIGLDDLHVDVPHLLDLLKDV